MRKSRLYCAVLLVAGLSFLSNSALAIDVKEPDNKNPVLTDPGPGGDACGRCKKAAYDTYQNTVDNKCKAFTVNLSAATKAACIKEALAVYEQDIDKCVADGTCA